MMKETLNRCVKSPKKKNKNKNSITQKLGGCSILDPPIFLYSPHFVFVKKAPVNIESRAMLKQKKNIW